MLFSQFSFEQSAKRPVRIIINLCLMKTLTIIHLDWPKNVKRYNEKKQAVVSYCILQRIVGISNLVLSATFDRDRACVMLLQIFSVAARFYLVERQAPNRDKILTPSCKIFAHGIYLIVKIK